MKKLCYFVVLDFFFSTFRLFAEPLNISLGAESAILINGLNGKILYEKNAFVPSYPASTTKIATALYALHLSANQLDRKMTAAQDSIASISPQAKRQSNYRSPPHWLETDSTHIGIKKGEIFRFYDLLFAMLVSSANDASNVISQNLGGTIPKYMEGLNLHLKSIGCNNTFFNNPHGLHHPKHVTTAYDLSLVAKEAMKYPLFRKIVSTVRYACPETNLEHERTFIQTNLLLRNGAFHYPKAIGVKTGTTSAAGKNLIAAAEEHGRMLIAVVFGYRGGRDDLYRDVIKMFETAFSEKKMRRYLLPKGEQKFIREIKGAKGLLKTYLPEGLFYDFYPSEETTVKASIVWEELIAPITQGQKVATVKIVDEEENMITEKDLLSSVNLKPTLWQTLFHKSSNRKILFYASASFIIFMVWSLRRKVR